MMGRKAVFVKEKEKEQCEGMRIKENRK